MPGVRESVLSMMRLSRFSIAQPNSAIKRAPTMRPLPFKRVEAAPQGSQRFQVHRILIPEREAPLDRCDLLLRLLDEQLEELRIDRVRLGDGNQRMSGRLRALGALLEGERRLADRA